MNHLLIAAIITIALYMYNISNDNEMSMLQYLLIFIIVAFIANFFMRTNTFGLSESMMGYGNGNQSIKEAVSGAVTDIASIPNSILGLVGGKTERGDSSVTCYNVPYKVLSTQYGDKAILAGYNEFVEPYQTGAAGLYEPPFRGPQNTVCDKISYTSEDVI